MKRFDGLEFKELVRTKKLDQIQAGILTKARSEKSQMVGDRQLKFIISTADVDRHMDKVHLDAWNDVQNYMKNPVILFGHNDQQPPVAKCVDISRDKKALYGVAEFVDRDMPVIGEFADMVLRMCKGGFLTATSVGFVASEFEETKDEDRGAGTMTPGFDFTNADLMEFSIVTVPANPHALLVKSILTQSLQSNNEKSAIILNNLKTRRTRQLELLGLE
jgi:phage head maturation protease